MDSRALFYQDSHLCHFTAQVTQCRPAAGGWAVCLDQTAFYPEGGLQPFVQALNQSLRGRGGGKPHFVQGSVSATRGEIEAFLQTAPAGEPV